MPTVRELITRWGFEVDEAPLKKIDNGVKNITVSLGVMAAAFGAAGAAMGFFLSKAGEFEQAEIAFETMLGSAEAAAKALDDIREFTKTTPFELKDTLIGAKRLLAYNIEAEKLIPTLTSLGNIAAGVGRERLPFLILALGQVKTATKLRGQELRQFTEAGVPLIGALAEQFGKKESEIFEMVSKGQVTFENVEAAITKMTTGSGKFADLMKKQSKTYLGIWSNIRDTLNLLAIDIGKKVLPIGKQYLKLTLDWLNANSRLITLRLEKFFQKFIKAVSLAAKVIKSVIAVSMDLINIFGGLEAITVLLGKAFLIAFSAATVFGIGQVVLGIFSLVKAFKTLGVVGFLSNVAAFLVPILIGAAVIALLAVFEDLFSFVKNRGTVIEDFLNNLGIPKEKIEELRTSLKKLAKAVKEAGKELFDAFLNLFGTSESEEAGKNVDKNIKRLEKMVSIIDSLASAFQRLGKFFNTDKELADATGLTPGEVDAISSAAKGAASGKAPKAITDALKSLGKGGVVKFEETEKDPETGESRRFRTDRFGNKIFSTGEIVTNPDAPSFGERLLSLIGFGPSKTPATKVTTIEQMDILITESENPEATAQAVSDSLGEKLKEAERDTVGQVAK